MSGDTLRAKLVEADLARQAGTERVDVALAVFAEWLREQAAARDARVTYWSHHQDTDEGRATLERAKLIRATLRELADSISPKEQERD